MSVKYGFGDLVKVVGYHPRIFRIDGYHVDTWHYPGETWTEQVFDLVDVASGVFIEAEVDDLTLVVRADKADEYLAKNPAPIESESFSIDLSGLKYELGGVDMAKQERQPTVRELSAKAAEEKKKARIEKERIINSLLDEVNDYKSLVDQFNDEEYKSRVEYLILKLTEVTTDEG